MIDPGKATRDEIIAVLFQAAMSGDIQRFAHENAIEVSTLRQWKVRYLEDYLQYLEAVLFRIQDQIDY